MTLGWNQPLVKMSTRNISGGKGGRCVRLTSPSSSAECHKIWEPKPSEPSAPHRTCYGTPLPFTVTSVQSTSLSSGLLYGTIIQVCLCMCICVCVHVYTYMLISQLCINLRSYIMVLKYVCQYRYVEAVLENLKANSGQSHSCGRTAQSNELNNLLNTNKCTIL
jgi:hypothetical protein